MKKFVYAIAIIALSVSSCQDLTVERSNKVIKVGKVSIANSTQVTKASSGTNVTNDGDVIVEESIEASETPLTKAGEINTVNFEQFFLDGFLDVSIKDKVAADPRDKANLNFMKGAEVKKEDASWSLNGEYYWRNLVDHYFWAYAGSVIDLEPVAADDFTSMKFSFDASSADSDLIIAGPVVKGGDIDHSSHGSDCTIDALVFNHALAEIVVDPSGLVAKEESADAADPSRKLTVTPSFYSIIGEANCVVDGSDDSIVWSEGKLTEALELDVNGPNFLIPQKKASILEVNIIDDLTNSSFPHIAELSEGNWMNGYRYTYKLSSTIVVPHYQKESGIEGFGFNASGNKPANELVGGLQSKYIKTIDMEWIGLPKGSGSGDYLIFYLADGELTKEQVANSNIAKATQLSGSINGVNYHVIVKCHVKDALTTTSQDGATVVADGSKITVSNILLPDDDKVYNLYGYYEGGSNGGSDHKNSNLILQGLNVTISSRRY